jgi:hypothetical protein
MLLFDMPRARLPVTSRATRCAFYNWTLSRGPEVFSHVKMATLYILQPAQAYATAIVACPEHLSCFGWIPMS